jgi:hypothetical protein
MTENSHCVRHYSVAPAELENRRGDRIPPGESLRATCRSASQLKRERLGQLPRNGMDRLPSGAV